MPPSSDIFLHIPKTAGTTLRFMIQDYYEPEAILSIWSPDEESLAPLKQLSSQGRQKIRLLHGHIPFGVSRFFDHPTTSFTFLRHPVDRVISLYYYMLNDPENPLHDKLVSDNHSLEEWVNSGEYEMVDNGQTRYLSGAVCRVPYGELTRDHLLTAQKNLSENIDVVGLTERFDQSLVLLQSKFGWRKQYYFRANVSARRPTARQLPESTMAAIVQANQFDLELYELGRRLFAKQIAAGGVKFQIEQARYRIGLWLHQNYWTARRYSLRTEIRNYLSQKQAQKK